MANPNTRYFWSNGFIGTPGQGNTSAVGSATLPCGAPNSTTPFAPCCAVGDLCMEGNLCHYTHSQVNGSGYYASGCNDLSMKDPSCAQMCKGNKLGDAVWDPSVNQWKCCSWNNSDWADCQDPTAGAFVVPPPNQLAKYATPAGIRTAVSTSSTSIAISSAPTASLASSPAASATVHTSLSQGGQIGVGVGIAVGIIALVATLVFMLWRRRRGRVQTAQDQTLDDIFALTRQPSLGQHVGGHVGILASSQELSADSEAHEMPAFALSADKRRTFRLSWAHHSWKLAERRWSQHHLRVFGDRKRRAVPARYC